MHHNLARGTCRCPASNFGGDHSTGTVGDGICPAAHAASVNQRQTGAPLLPFLGREAETATVAAELALRYGAALIPAR